MTERNVQNSIEDRANLVRGQINGDLDTLEKGKNFFGEYMIPGELLDQIHIAADQASGRLTKIRELVEFILGERKEDVVLDNLDGTFEFQLGFGRQDHDEQVERNRQAQRASERGEI